MAEKILLYINQKDGKRDFVAELGKEPVVRGNTVFALSWHGDDQSEFELFGNRHMAVVEVSQIQKASGVRRFFTDIELKRLGVATIGDKYRFQFPINDVIYSIDHGESTWGTDLGSLK